MLAFSAPASAHPYRNTFVHHDTIVAETKTETRIRLDQERHNINRLWAPHWAPDYGGRTLPFVAVAALAEAAGMPGVTMAQIAQGESGLRPGSAGVDAGGTVGYGIWAITAPFADSIVSRYGGYEQMWNPVRNAAAAAEIYRANGIGAWYGTGYVTNWDAHYHGRLEISELLGGDSFRRALKRR